MVKIDLLLCPTPPHGFLVPTGKNSKTDFFRFDFRGDIPNPL
jgi:hypothetical protein